MEQLVLAAIKKCEDSAAFINERNDGTIENLIEALILSGIAIGLVGASRPASGEEHHLAHCWEMMLMKSGSKGKWLHGNYVGVGVSIILEAYKYLSRLDLEELYNSREYAAFERSKWEKNIKEVYGDSGKSIIEFKQQEINFNIEDRKENFEKITSKWTELQNIFRGCLPEPAKIKYILGNSGAACSPKDLGFTKYNFIKSFIAAKDIRKRYGVLQLLEDMGQLEAAAEYIAELYY